VETAGKLPLLKKS